MVKKQDKTAKKQTSIEKKDAIKLNFDLPSPQEYLKAGVQFGHHKKRWNPRIKDYIFAEKKGIHIIDIAKTHELLEKALLFLVEASKNGNILFVGTKRQARDIVKKYAVESGSYYVTHRWVGGLLTNFSYIRRSLKKLAELEKTFDQGVEGRTKFEVSKMQKNWERLNRLYEGVKTLDDKPSAIIIVDAKYELNAVREARAMGIPVVAIIDTNADPNWVNYPVVGNDDAISSIELFMKMFANAIKQTIGKKAVKHQFKDYSKIKVAIKKTIEKEDQEEEVKSVIIKSEKLPEKKIKSEGILESVQKAKEMAKQTDVKKSKSEAKKSSKVNSRTLKALEEAGISLEKAKAMPDDDLLALKGIGQKALNEIRNL